METIKKFRDVFCGSVYSKLIHITANLCIFQQRFTSKSVLVFCLASHWSLSSLFSVSKKAKLVFACPPSQLLSEFLAQHVLFHVVNYPSYSFPISMQCSVPCVRDFLFTSCTCIIT